MGMEYDAVVVGSGPNGLASAIALQQQGLSVLIVEGRDTIGGGLRSAELTLPGFIHDVCSAIHPMAVASPFFKTLPLENHGLEFIHPQLSAAHPFGNGEVAVLADSVDTTAALLDKDAKVYQKLIAPLVEAWPSIAEDVLAPLGIPNNPVQYTKFGLNAIRSAHAISKRFATEKAKGLWAGMAAHSMLPLTNLSSAAIGLVLCSAAHLGGWPIPKGGSQSIANALASYFKSLGGKIETGLYINSLEQLPSSKAVLCDVSPKQLFEIAGQKFSAVYNWQLNRYRYGMGVYKIDWALDAPIPFKSDECKSTGTVH